MNYTEETFKNSKWTVFFNTACYNKTPYEFYSFQCPRGVAEDILRNNGLDPNHVDCIEHGSTRFSPTERVDDPTHMAKLMSTSTWLVVRADAIPYLEAGIWKITEKGVQPT